MQLAGKRWAVLRACPGLLAKMRGVPEVLRERASLIRHSLA